MGDVLPPKRQTVVDRLKRRFEVYRRHQNSCLPGYEQAENGLYENQRQETLLLKQRFLESKAKKAKSNKSDHHRTYKESVTDGGKSTTHTKPLKRPADSPIPNPSADCANSEDSEKPSKLLRTDITQDKLPDLKPQQQPLSSFSVQIVQQFSKTPHSQQSQQTIQTNVTVKPLNKPLTSPVPQSATNNQSKDSVCNPQDNQQGNVLLGNVECKQEKDCNPTDLCQFKGGQNSNSDRLSDTFPSIAFTDDSGDDVIHPDLLKDLIDDVFTNSTDIMEDFNFDDSVGSIKDQEDATKDIIGDLIKESSTMQLRPFQTDSLFVNTSVSLQQQQHHQQQQQQQHQQQLQQHQHLKQQQQNNIFKNISSAGEVPITSIVTSAPTPPTTASSFYNTASQRLPSYGSSSLSIPNGLNLDFKLSEPSPAALTLKQMAEQHQNMQQKQQQQQFVNSPLTNRPSPFNQDSFNSHMNTMRTTNNYLPGTNTGLSNNSPKTPNSNNIFNAFDRQINNMNSFANNQSLNNLPTSNQSLNSLSAGNPTISNLPASNQSLNNIPASNQPLNNIPASNQPLNSMPTSNQTMNNLPTNNQPLSNLPSNNQQLNNMPISPNNIFEADIHTRTSNVLPEVDRAKQPSCQTIQQQQQQKPPAYVSTRPLTHFTENQQMRLQSPVGNQHQRPMGRQFQNSMQIAQTSQMHTGQGHHNPQQLQANHDMKQQHHMMHQSHTNAYVSFPSQQPVNNSTFHVSMSQSISYSPQFSSSQAISRPPPEYKAHHPNLSVENVNLIEQLNSPSHVLFNNPSKNNNNSKFARQQKTPNVTITPDGTAISSNWRHMMTDQQSNQFKISNFQNSYGNFVRNEQQQTAVQQQPQLFAQYRMPSNQMPANRMVRPNLVPNQMLIQQRQRLVAQQQRQRNPSEMEQQQHSSMVISNNVISGLSSGYGNHPDISRADGNQFNLDFLDNIESSASDLLNFDQVMQGSGTHFQLLDDMEILGK